MWPAQFHFAWKWKSTQSLILADLAAERACRTAMRILMEFNLSHFNGFNIFKRPICQNSWVVTAINLPHCILGPLDHENTKIHAEVEVIKVGVEHDPV